MISGALLARTLAEAALLVARVASGRSLSEELPRDGNNGRNSRAAVLDVSYGTLRRYGRGQAIVAALSRKPPDPAVAALLWCALYALSSGRHADYTVVDQAVHACALLNSSKAKPFVNGLLRSYLRERRQIESRLEADGEAKYQHPGWWIDHLRVAYPDAWERVLAAGNSHPPMTLRVNLRRIPRDDYAQRLAAAGLTAKPLGTAGLLLTRPVPVARLPEFAGGEVSVQDYGAQRAAVCMDLRTGQRVLDACAAPGGKTAHILESADVEVTALDADAERCIRVAQNLDRLRLSATVARADCTALAEWWDGRPFDRILADVPCSASGVVRRHPDVKWLRRPSDILQFARRQAGILDALWRTLRPDGKLLYVTCSVFPEENEELVQSFIARANSARRLPLPDGAAAQWLPDREHDGFFYALIHKSA